MNISINSIVGSLMSFSVKYGIQIIMAHDHATASRLTERLLMNFARLVEQDAKKLQAVG